jgi:hypothetical protein
MKSFFKDCFSLINRFCYCWSKGMTSRVGNITSNTFDSSDDDGSNVDQLIIAFIFLSLVIFICCLSPCEVVARFIGRCFWNRTDDRHIYVVDSEEAFEKEVIMKVREYSTMAIPSLSFEEEELRPAIQSDPCCLCSLTFRK